jgi:hypothetical protein
MGMKMKDDEQLEKLFEQMSREQVKMMVNQNSPSKREPAKRTNAKKATVKKASGTKKTK